MTTTIHRDSDRLETAVEDFEAQWRDGGRPEIEQSEFIIELIAVDLEYRWKTSDRRGPLLEQYAKRLPQLGSLDDLPEELIAEEYRVRQRFGDRPPAAEYAARFSRHGQALLAALAEVDADLRNEYGEGPAALDVQHPHAQCRSPNDDPRAELDHHDYAIRRLLGRGGMSRVYTAVNKVTDEAVALKVLHKSLIHSRRASARFLREARIARQFDEHGLVNAYGTGRLPDGGYFMAMRLIDGTNLLRVASGLRLTSDDAVACVVQIAQLVELLHLRGYLHCDLKPSNVLVDSQAGIWLSDFGMAQPIHPGDRTAEDAAALGGTYAYMAPEQLACDVSLLSPASDVFALGGMLHFLLTGEPPRISSSPAAGEGCSAEDIAVKLADVSRPIRQHLARCLETDPSRRFPSAIELADALADCYGQSLM